MLIYTYIHTYLYVHTQLDTPGSPLFQVADYCNPVQVLFSPCLMGQDFVPAITTV